MLSDRNLTVHIYDEELAKEICNNIINKYINAFEQLLNRIEIRIQEQSKFLIAFFVYSCYTF